MLGRSGRALTFTKPMENSVLIAITHTGQTFAGLESMIAKFIGESKIKCELFFSNKHPIYENRNYIVQYFLKTNHSHLLFIDSDNPPLSLEDNPLNMIKRDVDVVGGVYPMWKQDHHEWCALIIKDNKYIQTPFDQRKGLQEVDAIATGCMLIKRKVLETVRAPFLNEFDKNGLNALGDDYAFCKRARFNGFRVYADWDVMCDHIKMVPLFTIVKALKRSYDEGYKKGKG